MYKESISNHHVYPLGWDDSFGMRIKAGMWMVDRRVAGDLTEKCCWEGRRQEACVGQPAKSSHGVIASSCQAWWWDFFLLLIPPQGQHQPGGEWDPKSCRTRQKSERHLLKRLLPPPSVSWLCLYVSKPPFVISFSFLPTQSGRRPGPAVLALDGRMAWDFRLRWESASPGPMSLPAEGSSPRPCLLP